MEFRIITNPQEKVVLPGELVSAVVPLHDLKWGEEAALIVDLGEKRTGGHSVEVLDVTFEEGRLDVWLKVVTPGPGAFVTQVMTHPYAVRKVDRTRVAGPAITVVAHDPAGNEIGRQVISL